MPSLKSLRKRIATVRSTQQITRAMKMVAAARLRRAQEAAENARPYIERLTEMLGAVVSESGPEVDPLLARRRERRLDVIVLSSDRGLCGGYNANLLRTVEGFVRQHSEAEASLLVVGRKGYEHFRRRHGRIVAHRLGILTTPVSEMASALADEAARRFVAEQSDALYLAYSRSRSALSQVPTVVPLLPVVSPTAEEPPREYILEPPRPRLLAQLLPRYIEALITQALREAIASEHGARMTAMENATKNAAEMIERLTLSMNRARQAAITTELMEIVSGAEALKG